jgi:hypothetical protein
LPSGALLCRAPPLPSAAFAERRLCQAPPLPSAAFAERRLCRAPPLPSAALPSAAFAELLGCFLRLYSVALMLITT